VMSKAFRAGEKVTVSTDRQVVGASNGDFSFTIGESTGRKNRRVESPRIGKGTVQAYATRQDITPPSVTISTNKPGTAPGLIFLAPKAGRGQDGPMIIDNSGDLVWFRPMQGKIAADFRAQTLDGRPVLTWWEGQLYGGDGDGIGRVLDTSYKPVAIVRAGNGYSFDLHEFTITPRNTALVLAYERYKRDLRPWGGRKDARVVDNIVQEIDLKTGLVLFEWHSFGNVAIKDSFAPLQPSFRVPYDYFHANSVDVDADGDFLVSARNTWGVYKIDRETGRIVWTLGGKRSTFKLGPGMRFAWQHDARRRPDGTLSLFDNSAPPGPRKRSRALVVGLDETNRTATLLGTREHPRRLRGAIMGNAQTLANGNIMVGWGSQRYFSEFAADGRLVWDAHLSLGFDTYRAYRANWTGRPHTVPRAAGVRRRGGGMNVYASWNGATEVASWDVLAGPRPDALQQVATSPRRGFETVVGIAARAAYVAVRAKDAAGQALATSPTRRVSG
jgi:hypothetical protein